MMPTAEPTMLVVDIAKITALSSKGKRMFTHLLSEFMVKYEDLPNPYQMGFTFASDNDLSRFVDIYNNLQLSDKLRILNNKDSAHAKKEDTNQK